MRRLMRPVIAEAHSAGLRTELELVSVALSALAAPECPGSDRQEKLDMHGSRSEVKQHQESTIGLIVKNAGIDTVGYRSTPFRADIYKIAAVGTITFAVFYMLKARLMWEDLSRPLVLSAAFLAVNIALLYISGLKEE